MVCSGVFAQAVRIIRVERPTSRQKDVLEENRSIRMYKREVWMKTLALVLKLY